MLSVSLGHEFISVLAVLVAFFCGIALGGWTLDGHISCSAYPDRWYVILELIIGCWALILMVLIPWLNPLISKTIGVAPSPLHHWTVSFVYPFCVLLPATLAMGATLPAIDRFYDQVKGEGGNIAGLYGINTLGAVVGTAATTFLLIPAFGLATSSVLLALLNVLVAAGVLTVRSSIRDRAVTKMVETAADRGLTRVLITLFITGLLGIGFETLMIRILSQLLENTVFSFAVILIVFLLGTSVGAGIYHRIQKSFSGDRLLPWLLIGCGMSCLCSIALLFVITPLFSFLQEMLGGSKHGSVIAELAVSLVVFLFPTVFMGAIFSNLAQSLKRLDYGAGRALCLNTFGGALGPLLFVVLLLPVIGSIPSLLIIPLGYVFCMPQWRLRMLPPVALVLGGAMMVAFSLKPERLLTLQDGESVVHYREGVMASVAVVKDEEDGLHLKVNNHFQMGGTTSVFSDRRQAYLPMLLHPGPSDMLFLGLGSGVTFGALGMFPDIEATGVELLPEVIETLPLFEKAAGDIGGYGNLNVQQADARRYVSTTSKRYDIIVADLFHPARDGAGSLYTLEHFRTIKSKLADGGIFCQWLPLYQLDLEMFKVITNTFLQVFPDGQAYLAHYSIDQPIIGLIGGTDTLRYPEKWYQKRLAGRALRRQMSGFGYDSIYSLLGTFIGGGEALHALCDGSAINTDRYPIVQFRAPDFVYSAGQPAGERLLNLLEEIGMPDPESILTEVITEEDYLARERLISYWQARDSFLQLGTQVNRTSDVRELYERARKPLLAVVRQSVDFSAAYFPLISIAYDLYPHDRDSSYTLLRDLELANPLRREAGALRRKLFHDSVGNTL